MSITAVHKTVIKYDIQDFYEVSKLLEEERKSGYSMRTYISLFSSAGVGCYGFKQEGYYCVATVELLERRLKIQQYNRKCICGNGYILGDMTLQETKDKVMRELDMWKNKFHMEDLDVLIATPPCQGMSVANHKKKNELGRNSLVVESINMIRRISPKFFIFENVRAFLTTTCTDLDGIDRPIREAIEKDLEGKYNILYRVVNFKDYGNPSSRTRTLVIGVRKDLREITPYDIFPDRRPERTLRQVIGHLPSLKTMGEIDESDIYHNFKRYNPIMQAWIADIKEGQSAFDNTDASKIPHTVKNGVVVYNANKNGDKYTRQCWDKVAPCIHTRNDILASQNTVHPADNRVFSIRELMLMMSVPEDFRWSDKSVDELNAMSLKDKEAYLKKEEMNIRQNLGEAVPTVIFRQIASKIRQSLNHPIISEQEAANIVDKNNLKDNANLLHFIASGHYKFAALSKIAELANSKRQETAAYYTRQDICFSIVRSLPDAKKYTEIKILEPSIGVGNFLPSLIDKYRDVPSVNIDVVDIDPFSLRTLQVLLDKIEIPANVKIKFINADFLCYSFDTHYDIVIGNPPFGKITKDKQLLNKYRAYAANKETNNVFAFFIEKAMKLGDIVSLIVPKSLISAPEFNITRKLMNMHRIERIIDFGEKGFRGVKIETLNITLSTIAKQQNTIIESYITDEIIIQPQSYITDSTFPYWLIYRNTDFDEVACKLSFNIFRAFRDRYITKSITKSSGRIRVLKSRNIGDNHIKNIPDYDCYIDNIEGLEVAKFINKKGCVLIPNLTYNPRACFLPCGCITDGSVAILIPKDNDIDITNEDLSFYATKTFSDFYTIARNRGTRSLNIDNNSVFFFGKRKI